jgi:pyrroloquinoline quinone (PQQ) biosynthesis protein C
MAAGTSPDQKAVPANTFLEELEGYRRERLGGKLLRERTRKQRTLQEMADEKRERYKGGDPNIPRNGDRYVMCPDKRVRKMQLRKIVDEAGRNAVDPDLLPSHGELNRWEAYEFGVTPEEVQQLLKEDPSPEQLILNGWWLSLHRTSHWAVSYGSALVGEGEKRIPGIREKLLREIDELREEYAELGVKNVERALAEKIEHAGVDIEHAEMSANVVRRFVNTPELQDEMRRVFKLVLQGRGTKGGF